MAVQLLPGMQFTGLALDALNVLAQINRELPGRPDLEIEPMRAVLVTLLLLVYCFVIGAAVGSFLNVVVYRMPLGINLAYPPSRCPTCRTPIRAWDNIPVLSWLILRGRCRTCKTAISPRYFLVELSVGILFLLLLLIEVFSGGANLPVREPNDYGGVELIVKQPQWDLIGIYLYHCMLLSVLFAMLLIRSDGNRIPTRLVMYAILIGLGLPLFWPDLRPVPAILGPAARTQAAWLEGLIDGGFGLAAGAFLGVLFQPRIGRKQKRGQLDDFLLALMIVGAYLGWQAVVSVALASAAARFLVGLAAQRWKAFGRSPAISYPAAFTAVQIALWRAIAEITWWPGPYSSGLTFAAAVALIAVLSFGCRRLGY